MPQLPLLSGEEIIAVMTRFGWSHHHDTGSHQMMKKEGSRSVPVPKYDEVDRSLLNRILKQASIDKDEFIHMLSK